MSMVVTKNDKTEEPIAAPRNPDTVDKPVALKMDFIARIVQLPVVKQAMAVASSIYGKLKDSNRVMTWTLTRAELTMDHATDALPPAECLTKPLEKADNVLCSSLDYLENKVPAVKLPPQQILTDATNYLYNAYSRVRDFTLRKTSAVELYIFGTSFTAPTSISQNSTVSGTEASSIQKTIDSVKASRPDLSVYTSLSDVVDSIEKLQMIKKRMETEKSVTSSS